MGADRLASRRAGATLPPPRDFDQDRLELGKVHLGAELRGKARVSLATQGTGNANSRETRAA
jgi:hypothetical protein